MSDTYEIKAVKQAADYLYKKTISDRTWRKWKKHLYIPKNAKTVIYDHAVCLLVFALLRREHPRTKYRITEIKNYLEEHPYTKEMLKEQMDEALKAQIVGKQLPTLIRQVTGRNVTLRTIYRWSKAHKLDFAASKVIPHKEVQKWIDIAS
jgi:hypothetical protein